MKIGLGATVKLFQMYLKGGPTPPLDPLHMHISPWYQFRTFGAKSTRRESYGVGCVRPVPGGPHGGAAHLEGPGGPLEVGGPKPVSVLASQSRSLTNP